MDILKAAPGFPAEYLNYLLDFTRKPIETITSITTAAENAEPKTGTENAAPKTVAENVEPKTAAENAEPKVSGKLGAFLLTSVGVGFVINIIGTAAGMAPDKSDMVQVIGRIDEKYLPFAVAIAIVMFAILAHLIFLVVGFGQARLGEGRFTGSVYGAINAFTGFATWGIPLIMVCLVIMRLVAAHSKINPLFLLGLVMPLGLALCVYFIAALAAGYRITPDRAGTLFGLSVVLTWLVADLFL